MSTPSGQGSLISACWTIWLERRSTDGLTSLRMTNSFPVEMVIPLIRTHWIGITSLHFSIISHLLDLIHTHSFFVVLVLLYVSLHLSPITPVFVTANANIMNEKQML